MYIIEGNIGAGKSTFLKLIEQNLAGVEIGYEPLGDWAKEVYGQSLLANFYQEPKRWAYSMETFAMQSRVRAHIKDQEHAQERLIIERSIYSGHYCFAKNSFANGFMTPLEWDMYCSWFNLLIPGKCHAPRGFIYLRVTPEVALERIKKRSRDGEGGIPLSYLEQLHQCHDDFLIDKKDVLPELMGVPVLVVDCNEEFEANPEQLKRHLSYLQDFMNETSLPVCNGSIAELRA